MKDLQQQSPNEKQGLELQTDTNPLAPGATAAPVDPSNTSHIGQNVEQGIISKTEGISEQSSKWEDTEERVEELHNPQSQQQEHYLNNPSPEENTPGDQL